MNPIGLIKTTITFAKCTFSPYYRANFNDTTVPQHVEVNLVKTSHIQDGLCTPVTPITSFSPSSPIIPPTTTHFCYCYPPFEVADIKKKNKHYIATQTFMENPNITFMVFGGFVFLKQVDNIFVSFFKNICFVTLCLILQLGSHWICYFC